MFAFIAVILVLYLLRDFITSGLMVLDVTGWLVSLGQFLLSALAVLGFIALLRLFVRLTYWSVRFLPSWLQRILLFKIGH